MKKNHNYTECVAKHQQAYKTCENKDHGLQP